MRSWLRFRPFQFPLMAKLCQGSVEIEVKWKVVTPSACKINSGGWRFAGRNHQDDIQWA